LNPQQVSQPQAVAAMNAVAGRVARATIAAMLSTVVLSN
jgi:hypothetical protein